MLREKPNELFVEGIRELLAEGVPVVFKAKGNSMLPFIRGGQDEVYLVGPTAVSEGDVLLCEVSKRQYVLHRLIRQKGDCLILMGDGNLRGTESCNRKDVIGKAVKIVRGGKAIDCQSRSYRWASGCWVTLLPLRRVLLKLYRIL
ncbi:S24/S26 family peptidase [Parabacteroides johnsonii]